MASVPLIAPSDPPETGASTGRELLAVGGWTLVGRVVDRVTDTTVRNMTADIVSKVAERLVRDEIERIKSGLE